MLSPAPHDYGGTAVSPTQGTAGAGDHNFRTCHMLLRQIIAVARTQGARWVLASSTGRNRIRPDFLAPCARLSRQHLGRQVVPGSHQPWRLRHPGIAQDHAEIVEAGAQGVHDAMAATTLVTQARLVRVARGIMRDASYLLVVFTRRLGIGDAHTSLWLPPF